ncbi:uncharacterized protein LOC129959975 [Argiope bruennichi]|uniref:uncharacterized protein LOC129959975 n=1 Tax=Argiope bruennichi TaxID=94029 RepID=UPI0024958A25|nr:uncharacterized protein LOC129959975 [Argiope bruennichi]
MTDRKNFIITWRIKNFSFCWHKEEEEISCPEFNIKGIDGSKWKLYLFPRASKSKMSWSIACYLHLEKENGPRGVEIAYELSALGCDGLPLETKTCTDCFMQENDWAPPLILKQKTVFLEKRQEFLPKDTLTIRCIIWQFNQGSITAERYFATTRIDIEKVPLFGIVRKTRSRKNVENKYRVEFLQESTETPVFINIKCINGSPYAEIHPKGHELKFCKCKMNFTNDSGMEVLEAEDAFLFRLNLIPLYEKMPVWMFPLLPASKNENYDPQYSLEMKNLTLRCEIVYSTGIITINNNYSINTFQNGCIIKEKRQENLPSLKDDLLTLMQNSDYYDIKLKTQNKTFPAHKSILSARSLFFKNKLADMKNVDCIFVKDMDNGTLYQMLVFLYTDTIENLELENAMKLYIASARYGIPSLQHRCSSFLQNHLDASTCCDALKAADQYQDGDLKKAAQNYILDHEGENIGSHKWQDLERFTEVIEEVLHLKRMKT